MPSHRQAKFNSASMHTACRDNTTVHCPKSPESALPMPETILVLGPHTRMRHNHIFQCAAWARHKACPCPSCFAGGEVAQLCAEVASLWADVGQLQEHDRNLAFATPNKNVPKQARQEAVHAQTAQLAADVEQLRIEVATLWKRSNSLERSLARPSTEVSSWSLHLCTSVLGHQWSECMITPILCISA